MKPSFSLLSFQAVPELSDSYNLYWVNSDIYVTQIAFLDWLTPSSILTNFISQFNNFRPLHNTHNHTIVHDELIAKLSAVYITSRLLIDILPLSFLIV